MAHRIAAPLFALAFLGAMATRASAQNAPSRLDAGHSYASLWMGRETEVSVMVNVGVAQVGGTVAIDASKPAISSLHFALVPGGAGAELLAPDGTLRADIIAQILRYTAMSFRSTQARIRHDGRLEFPGELTMVHVTREELPPVWNSANNTPSYTDPETARVTRRATFVLVTPRAEFLSAYLQTHAEIVLSATMDSAAFPELAGAVLDSDWPIVAEDEHCQPVSEWISPRDYAGWNCTGKAITITPALQPTQTSIRDYSGPLRYNAPVNGPVTILLHLKLAPPAAAAAAAPPGR